MEMEKYGARSELTNRTPIKERKNENKEKIR